MSVQTRDQMLHGLLTRDRLITVGLWNICRTWDDWRGGKWHYGLFHDHDGYLNVATQVPGGGAWCIEHRCTAQPPDYLVGYLDMIRWAMKETTDV
jgi:hypothetical protein